MQNQYSRVIGLDWLRGIMAFSIMFYHLSDFTITQSNPLDASTILGRLGVYGVSIFFVLSGLSMAIVYNKYFNGVASATNFYIRRIFRIWPLLWVVCLLKIVFTEYILHQTHYKWPVIFLNFTTLFGFVKPTAYIALGAWSIGNEMVYYAFTPLIIYLYNRKINYGNLFFLITFIVGVLFSFNLLHQDQTLAKQWVLYVNPFNNFFLYVFGITMYYNFNNVKVNQQKNTLILIASIILFCYLPFAGDLIGIVTGIGRIVFVLLSFLVVFCFYKMQLNFSNFFSKGLEILGAITYGVYLIHPIVYIYLNHFFKSFNISNSNLLLIFVPIITVCISLISYYYFELVLIKIGKKISIPVNTESKSKIFFNTIF